MKTLVSTLLFCCCILTACTPKYYPTARPAVDYSDKYADKLEPGSKLEYWGINFTIEKTTDGVYINKIYRPETRQLTHFVTYPTHTLIFPTGPTKEWWDDGSLAIEGQYVNGKRQGKWKGYKGESVSIGNYLNDLKEGPWVRLDSLDTKRNETNYQGGKKHGLSKIWDERGNLISEGIYANGKLESQKHYDEGVVTDDQHQHVEEKPRFDGCEDLSEEEKRFECSEKKFLSFIYNQIKYPVFARENGIQGEAVVTFVVEKDGQITDIKVRRGICNEIQAECERVVRSMPNWIPGKQDGKPVRVSFDMPIKFKLE